MSVDFLIKLRDGATMIADAANEQLERIAPTDAIYNEKDFDSLKWETKTGTKSDYEQTTKQANEDNEAFQKLQQILRNHNGFWQHNNWKFWFHRDNQDTIDRRKK